MFAHCALHVSWLRSDRGRPSPLRRQMRHGPIEERRARLR
ncbi:hypothetical protein AKJ09_07796 [Labilithrix luteola]|uniref:Uncharacterized protein n=1 Tax=Labilithrix luteola TaxID=1391654 RepID=A0A0K1Q5W7_9BACT|nr:hypothetical protein AKJ09_07796 [Labilithrix luteola]